MSLAVFAVRTANRPEVLHRCLAAAFDGCDVAQDGHWLVLDDSSQQHSAATREVARHWKRSGARLAYVDNAVTGRVAASFSDATFRSYFEQLVASPSCPTDAGRNFALAAGLSTNPDVLFFVDDDMVHRHGENCFFHWCMNSGRADSFVAAPRKLGIADMTYLDRLVCVLGHSDWARFITGDGISADPDLWYSAKNPLWKQQPLETDSQAVTERDVVSGQLMALRNNGAEWLPFPRGYNEDLNWSLLQSFCAGTQLLKVGGAEVWHLPPCLGHADAEFILSELAGTALTRALRQIPRDGEDALSTLAARLPGALQTELRQSLFLLMEAERVIFSLSRILDDRIQPKFTISNLKTTLADVGARLNSIDSREFARDWLDDFTTRRKMLLELQRNDEVQMQIRALFEASP